MLNTMHCFAAPNKNPTARTTASTQAVAQKVLFTISGLGHLTSAKQKQLTQNIMARLAILRKQFPEQLDQTDVDDITQQGEQEVALALEPYGYFQAMITHSNTMRITRSLMNKQLQQHWHIDYAINLGTPVRLTSVQIQLTGPGKNNVKLTQFINNSPLKLHAIFTSDAYNKTQDQLYTIAQNQGYIANKLTKHEIKINRSTHSASVYLTLDTGPKFYYGPITFSPTPYDTEFLQRFITFKPGQAYAPMALQTLQSTLGATKYFSNVMIDPNIKQAEQSDTHEVPITIDTQAVKAQQYKLGLGYGTNTGTRTSIGVDLFRITDTGQHLSALLNLSEVSTGLTSKYYIPGRQPAINQYTIGSYIGEFKPDAGNAYDTKFSTGYETALAHGWHSTIELNFLHEKFSIDDDDNPTEVVNLIYPSLHLSRLQANNPANPSKGTRLSLDSAAGGPASATSFIQNTLSASMIYPTSQQNYLLLSGSFGAIAAHDFATSFPLSMRYFAGGANSLRGYSYQSIGPGKYEKLISAEFQQRMLGNFYTGVFIDAGTASDNINQSLERGIGLAFIYRTGVGPINIDLAQANTQQDKPWRLEFSFGVNL